MFRIFLFSVLLIVSGCASYSTRTADTLDTEHPRYKTPQCQENLPKAKDQDQIKWSRTVIGPVAIFLTGGAALLPVVLANMSFDTKDELVAQDIAESCGGDPKSSVRIAAEIGGGAALNAVTSGTNLGPAVQVNQSNQ